MIPVLDKQRLPIIPYGPGMPYATVESLPENCVFLAPNGGIYLKQGEAITPVSDELLYNGEAVTYAGSVATLAYDNFQKIVSSADSDCVSCSLGFVVSTFA